MSHIFTMDTVRAKGVFTDYAPAGQTGAAIDPDSNAATVTIYNADERSIETGAATRDGVGIFHYDWTAPNLEGTYFIEFKGLFGTKPQISRYKVKVKFKPDMVET